MSRIPFVVSSITLALLAACAAEHPVTPAPAPVVISSAPVVAAPAPAAPVVVPQQPGSPAVVVQQPGTTAAIVVPPAPGPLRAGFGRVTSITPIPVAAAGGGTVNSASRRIGLRMDDGSTQYVDTTASPLAVGDRIEITTDGKMRHPLP